jgi:hypothetical protein
MLTTKPSAAFTAIFTLILGLEASAQTVCLSTNGIQSFDAQGDPSNVVINLNVGPNNQLIGGSWDVNLETVGGSFLSEASMAFSNSLGINDPNFNFIAPGAAINAPGNLPFSSGGLVLLSDLGFPNVVTRPDGILRLEFAEGFDDNPNAVDAFWSDIPAGSANVCPGIRFLCTNQAACDNAVLAFSDPPPEQSFDFSVVEGNWLSTGTDGQGLMFDYLKSFDQLFVAWFTYTLDPVPPANPPSPGIDGFGQRWLTALLSIEGNIATGSLVVSEGSAFDQPRPSNFRARAVGTISIEFTDCDAGWVSYQIDGLAISNQFPILPVEKFVNPNGFICDTD